MRKLLLLCVTLTTMPALAVDPPSTAGLAREYPLRVRIFHVNARSIFTNRDIIGSTSAIRRDRSGIVGDGEANVYEGGNPRGFDFKFDCETTVPKNQYVNPTAAKWKRKDKEMTLLVGLTPDGSKPVTCNVKTTMLDVAYMKKRGKVMTMSIADNKDWMQRHNYDPEHGKNNVDNAE